MRLHERMQVIKKSKMSHNKYHIFVWEQKKKKAKQTNIYCE